MVGLDDALALGIKAKDVLQNFAYDNSDLVYVVGTATVIIGGLFWLANRKPAKDPGEGTKMTKEEYILSRRELRQQEQNKIADALADGLLTAFTKGEISEDCYRRVHLRLGTQFGFKDMLPVKLTTEQLKEAMKKRSGKVYKPVPFPKETPKKRFKNALEELLSKI